jgi:hypothetical protein
LGLYTGLTVGDSKVRSQHGAAAALDAEPTLCSQVSVGSVDLESAAREGLVRGAQKEALVRVANGSACARGL